MSDTTSKIIRTLRGARNIIDILRTPDDDVPKAAMRNIDECLADLGKKPVTATKENPGITLSFRTEGEEVILEAIDGLETTFYNTVLALFNPDEAGKGGKDNPYLWVEEGKGGTRVVAMESERKVATIEVNTFLQFLAKAGVLVDYCLGRDLNPVKAGEMALKLEAAIIKYREEYSV